MTLPLCDICGKHPAVTDAGGLVVCSEACMHAAIRAPALDGLAHLEPRGCPTPGCCSAVEEIARLRTRLSEYERLTDEIVARRNYYRDEVERLRAGGCARDQRLTEHCAEAAAFARENAELRARLAEAREANARLRQAWQRSSEWYEALEELDRALAEQEKPE